MESIRTKSGASGPLVFVAIALLVLLPVLYVLSVGPAVWLSSHDYVSTGPLYYPLGWVSERCGPFRDALTWYMSLFVPSMGDW